MAVTGTGTQDDPYIVNTYNEIVTYSQKGRPVYLRLNNDIDCNDYGDSWEWTGINLSRAATNNAWCCYLDMYGHTIKNIMLKSGNILFDNYGGNFDRWKIYSSKKDGNGKVIPGKILNVFNNSGTHIFRSGDLTNISISINGTNLESYAFNGCKINQCSIYYKSSKLNDHAIYSNLSSYVKNSDLWFDITDLNSKGIYYVGSTSEGNIEDSRIRGTVAGKPMDNMTTSSGYRWGYLISRQNLTCTLLNSVIELDTSGLDLSSVQFGKFYFCPSATNTIINTDKMNNLQSDAPGIKCTTAEMRNSDSLNSKGFNVVEVSG